MIKPLALTALLCGVASPLVAGAASWPRAEWEGLPRSRYEPLLETVECKDFLQFMGLGVGRGKLRSDGMAVVHQGKVLFRLSKTPWNENRAHPIWSASKSVTSALVGAATAAGLRNPKGGPFSLEDAVADYLPRPETAPAQDELYRRMKVRHLLEMGSGYKWSESYEAGILGSNVLQMIYLSGYKNMTDYVLHQTLQDVGPGAIYNYSSGDMSLAMAVLKRSCEATPGCDYDRLPWKLLFEPLGMSEGVAFEQDGAGVFVGSSYAHMSLMDMARFGYLYLTDGKWAVAKPDGTTEVRRILPEGFVERTRTPNPSYLSEHTKVTSLLSDGVYGLTWWLNTTAKGFDEPSYPSFPRDMYAALGHYGQLIIVIPSMDLVLVRTGSDLEYNSKLPEMGTKLMPCLARFGVATQLVESH